MQDTLTASLVHDLDDLVRRPLHEHVDGYDELDRRLRAALDAPHAPHALEAPDTSARHTGDGTT